MRLGSRAPVCDPARAHLCNAALQCCLCFPATQLYSFTSNITNTTYILDTEPRTFAQGEAFCTSQGGHLVSYDSLQEQLEVEDYFIKKGYLIPSCHKNYWLGLTTQARGARATGAQCRLQPCQGRWHVLLGICSTEDARMICLLTSTLCPSFATAQKQGGRPNWVWLEPNTGSPTEDASFKHWGMYQVSG